MGWNATTDLSTTCELKTIALPKKIAATIPQNSKNRVLFNSYMKNEEKSIKFCDLIKESYAGWKIDQPSSIPRYHDYDVVYFECIYSRAIEQNNFLKRLFENTSQQSDYYLN